MEHRCIFESRKCAISWFAFTLRYGSVHLGQHLVNAWSYVLSCRVAAGVINEIM